MLIRVALTLLAILVFFPAPGALTQDLNILHPIPVIEERLREHPIEVVQFTAARPQLGQDRANRVVIEFPDGLPMQIKWKMPAPGAQGFNNEPRYDLAAYALQKLFLDEQDYVVPPTVLRTFPLAEYQRYEPAARPTFRNTSSVVVLLQYWLSSVTGKGVYDRQRFDADSVYARRFGDVNILTYLINHLDSNLDNLMISTEPVSPRLFAVDNDVAFRSQKSDRGTEWQQLRVNRLPQATVERLRTIQLADLERTLGVVAQFEIRDGLLIPVAPGENISRNRGVRQRNDLVQLGLTSTEIRDVHGRLQQLLKRVDSGRITTF